MYHLCQVKQEPNQNCIEYLFVYWVQFSLRAISPSFRPIKNKYEIVRLIHSFQFAARAFQMEGEIGFIKQPKPCFSEITKWCRFGFMKSNQKINGFLSITKLSKRSNVGYSRCVWVCLITNVRCIWLFLITMTGLKCVFINKDDW